MTILLTLLTALADEPTLSETAASSQQTEFDPIRGSCPSYAPVKGNLTPYSAEYCIFHVPGGLYYLRTDAERCFVSEEAAVDAGCRQSRR